VEAAGIEPASESDSSGTTTCVVRVQFSARQCPRTGIAARDPE
jgi:hypothetical protein